MMLSTLKLGDPFAENRKNTPYEIIIDRKEAIKRALEMQKDEYILLLGKGDEKYIQKCNEKIYFNEKEEVKKLILN